MLLKQLLERSVEQDRVSCGTLRGLIVSQNYKEATQLLDLHVNIKSLMLYNGGGGSQDKGEEY